MIPLFLHMFVRARHLQNMKRDKPVPLLPQCQRPQIQRRRRGGAAQAKLASGSSEVNKSLKVKVCMGVCMLAPPPRELPAFNSVIAAGVHTSLSVTWPRNTSEHKLPWRS